MTDLKLNAAETADVERVANEIAADVVAKTQGQLAKLEWTDDLDAEDWAAVQSAVIQRVAEM